MTTQASPEPGFLETFGRTIGGLRKGLAAPLIDYRYELELEKQKQQYQEQLDRQQAAIDMVAQLERQKKLATDYEKEPLQPGVHGVRPEFDYGDKLRQFQAYGQAGIDPAKMAAADTARLAAEAFASAIPDVTSTTGKINIGLGKEYRPDVYREDIAKADKARSQADDAALRLETVENLLQTEGIDPLLAADVAQNKQVFDTEKVTIEDKDGKTKQGMATLTPSGKYVGKPIEDITGQPLVIPTEAGDMTSDIKNTKYYAKLWGKSEADTAKILKSKATDTPKEFWSKTVTANSKGPMGPIDPYDMLTQSLFIWSTAKQGEPLPRDINKIIKTYSLNPNEEKEILELAASINENVEAPPVVAETPATAPGLNQPFYKIPGLSAGVGTAGTSQAHIPSAAIPEVPAVAPPPPPPTLKPLTPTAIQTAWTAIQKGEDPEKVQQALQQSGFDLSPEAVNRMAIDAINTGVPGNTLQQYLASIGINWKPTGT